MSLDLRDPGDVGYDAEVAAHAGKLYGEYKARVKDDNDPDQRGRVRLYVFGIMTGRERERSQWTDWAYPAMDQGSGAGADVGSVNVPPIGSYVWVTFVQGHPDHPQYHGGYWRDGEKVPALARGASSGKEGSPLTVMGTTVPASAGGSSTYPKNRMFETPEGIIVEYDDTPGNKRIRIRHPSGSQMEFRNPGDVMMNVLGDLLMGASSNLRLAAQQELRLSALLTLVEEALTKTTSITGDWNANVGGLLSLTAAGAATLAGATATLMSLTGSITIGVADVTLASVGFVRLGSPTAAKSAMTSNIIAKFNSHVHSGVATGLGSTGTTSVLFTAADASIKVKIE